MKLWRRLRRPLYRGGAVLGDVQAVTRGPHGMAILQEGDEIVCEKRCRQWHIVWRDPLEAERGSCGCLWVGCGSRRYFAGQIGTPSGVAAARTQGRRSA
jgi:hypothetical protein